MHSPLGVDASPVVRPIAGGFSLSEARARFDEFFCWTVQVEYPTHPSFLPAGQREAFAAYYADLPAAVESPAIARMLRGVWRGEAGWAARWIAARRRPRVLDAGSGFGRFAMLYA